MALILFPLALMAALSGSSFWGLGSLTEDIDVLANKRLPINIALGDMRAASHAAARYLWVAYSQDQDFSKRTQTIAEVRKRMKNFDDALQAFLDAKPAGKTMEAFSPVPGTWKQYSRYIEDELAKLEKNDRRLDEEVKRDIPTKLLNPGAVITDALREASQASREVTAKQVEDAMGHSRFTRALSILVSLGGGILLLAFGLLIASRLARALEDLVRNLGESGSQVSAASSQLSSASQQLSSGSTESAASLEETVASLEELTSMVKRNSDHSAEAAKLSSGSSQSAESGEKEIRNLITAMGEISESSKKIEEIINVIDDIAFQTNLLALNAAVEAARAGEQGKGFAVVADAVRSLAQRSATAAKDITVLIKDSVQKSEKGAGIADTCGGALKEIVTSVKKMADLNNEIASASREQSNGLSQISQAMTQMDQVTQGNAASAEEVAASSEEMNSQAVALQGMVSDLTFVVSGVRR